MVVVPPGCSSEKPETIEDFMEKARAALNSVGILRETVPGNIFSQLDAFNKLLLAIVHFPFCPSVAFIHNPCVCQHLDSSSIACNSSVKSLIFCNYTADIEVVLLCL